MNRSEKRSPDSPQITYSCLIVKRFETLCKALYKRSYYYYYYSCATWYQTYMYHLQKQIALNTILFKSLICNLYAREHNEQWVV